MFGLESLNGTTYAAAVVGLVLAEAIALYVGYGVLTARLSTTVLDAVADE